MVFEVFGRDSLPVCTGESPGKFINARNVCMERLPGRFSGTASPRKSTQYRCVYLSCDHRRCRVALREWTPWAPGAWTPWRGLDPMGGACCPRFGEVAVNFFWGGLSHVLGGYCHNFCFLFLNHLFIKCPPWHKAGGDASAPLAGQLPQGRADYYLAPTFVLCAVRTAPYLREASVCHPGPLCARWQSIWHPQCW